MSYQTAAYNWTTGNWGKGTVAKYMSGSPDGPDMKFVDGLEPGVYSVEIDAFARFGTYQSMVNDTIYCQFSRRDLDDNLFDIRNAVMSYTSTQNIYNENKGIPGALVWGLNCKFNVKYNGGDTLILREPDKIVPNPNYAPDDPLSDEPEYITENFFQGASVANMRFRVTKLC